MKLTQRLAHISQGVNRRPQSKSRIQFNELLPDLPDFGNPGLTKAENCMPHQNGYKEFPGLTTVSSALSGFCQGAVSALAKDGTTNYYAGDATKLYRLDATTWTDSSKSGGYACPADDSWEFARGQGDTIIAVNIADAMQKITMGGTAFSDLATSTLTPKARHIATVRQFPVIGNVDEGGTLYPNRVRWPNIDDDADWDQDAASQADYQDLDGPGGWIQKIVGGEYGVIFQEKAIWRMQYEGTPTVWRFDEVERNRGAWAKNSVVRYGRFVFYLAEDGFYVFDGVQSTPIGANKVDLFFFNELDETYKARIQGALDLRNRNIVWAYTTTDSAGNGDPDKMLIYNWPTQKWSTVDLDTEHLFSTLTEGYTLDTLDNVSSSVDALVFSLDSRVWTGGNPQFSAFNRSHVMAHFTATALDAVFETGERENAPGQFFKTNSVRPLVNGTSATITARVGSRTIQNEAVSFGSYVAINSNGEVPIRNHDRYHKVGVKITGGFDEAIGVEMEGSPQGWQ